MNDSYDNARMDAEQLPRVFITNDTGLDYSAAESYGQLVPVTRGSVDVFHPDRCQDEVSAALVTFNPARDLLLVSGAALAAVFATWFLSITFTTEEAPALIKLLLFYSKRRTYFVRTVEL